MPNLGRFLALVMSSDNQMTIIWESIYLQSSINSCVEQRSSSSVKVLLGSGWSIALRMYVVNEEYNVVL